MKKPTVFPAVLDALSQITETVTEAARSCGMDESSVRQLELAVDEASTNIINYAYPESSDGTIEVEWSCRDNEFAVILRDRGNAFDQTEPTNPNLDAPLEERQIGGLGRFFMQKCCDSLTYQRIGDCNVLTFVKKIKV
ncbi:MAG: ATP-binding protein [bacterium]